MNINEQAPSNDMTGKEIKKTDISSTWEEKREEILKGLEKKVAVSLDFEKVIDSLSIEDSHEMVKTTLRNFFEKIKTTFSQEVQDAFEELKRKIKEYNELNTEIEKIEYKEGGEDSEECNIKSQESVVLCDEIEKILENNDVSYIFRLEQLIESLIWKNEYVKAVKEDKIQLDENLLKIDLTKIEKIIYDTFNINIILNNRGFDEIKNGKNINGRHLSNTPINLIRGGEMDWKKTMEHEKIHNLTDGIQDISGRFYGNFLGGKIDRYARFLRLKAPKPMLTREKFLFTRALSPRHFLNNLHDEMLADILSGIRDPGAKDSMDQLMFRLSGTSNFTASTKEYIQQTFKTLIEKVTETGDTEFVDLVIDFIKQVEVGFERITKEIKIITDISSRLGPQAEKEIQPLLFLLRPTQYRHINDYLQFKYPSKFTEIDAVVRVLENFDMAALESFNASKVELTRQDKEKIKGIIRENAFSSGVKEYGIHSLEDLRKFMYLVQTLEGKLENSKKMIKDLNQQLVINFCALSFKNGLKDNLQNLSSLYERLNDEEKSGFKEAIKKSFNPITIDIKWKEIFNETFDLKKFKETPSWQVLSALGLTGTIEAMFKKAGKKKK